MLPHASYCSNFFGCLQSSGTRYTFSTPHDEGRLSEVRQLLEDPQTYTVKIGGKNNVDAEDHEELRRSVGRVVWHVSLCFRASGCTRLVVLTEGDNLERLAERYSPFSEAQELLLRECVTNGIEAHLVLVKSRCTDVSAAFVDGWRNALADLPQVTATLLLAGTTEGDEKAQDTFAAARLIVFVGTERKEAYMWKTKGAARVPTTGFRHLLALREQMSLNEYKLAHDVSCFARPL